jgi:TRAP-type mannitol/chloroaromatic compound transport system permease small subunit
MGALLTCSRRIDRLSSSFGDVVAWAVVAVVLLSAGNALARKFLHFASNGALELQLYLFAAIFLISGANTLLRNEHIRIDVLFSKLSQTKQMWIDIFGILFFLLPVAVMTAWMTFPSLIHAFESGQVSGNTGGLLLWPIWAIAVVGFVLLILQALSELIKRVAVLRGLPIDMFTERDEAAELLQALTQQHEEPSK